MVCSTSADTVPEVSHALVFALDAIRQLQEDGMLAAAPAAARAPAPAPPAAHVLASGAGALFGVGGGAGGPRAQLPPPAPPRAMGAGVWTCVSCTLENSPEARECAACGAAPLRAPWEQGDYEDAPAALPAEAGQGPVHT